MHTPRALFVASFLLVACGKDAPAPEASKDTTAVSTASPSASAMVAPPTNAEIAPSATPPTVTAKAPTSPEPELKEWDSVKADLSLVRNWDGPGCMARRVREWIRVGCAGATTKQGEPVSIQLVRGLSKAKYDVLNARGGSTMLVFPATEGLDGEATFNFSEGSFTFSASWPAGQPEPKTIGAFKAIEPPAEAAAEGSEKPAGDSAEPGAAAPAPKSGKPTLSTDPLPEVPVIEGAPSAEDWSAAKEVGVRGSDAQGCETKQIGEWFRVVCRSNDQTGKVTAATAVRGFDPDAGYLVTGNGAMVLLIKYTRGTDLAIDITWERKAGQLSLAWPQSQSGPPAMRGELVSRG